MSCAHYFIINIYFIIFNLSGKTQIIDKDGRVITQLEKVLEKKSIVTFTCNNDKPILGR